MAEFGFRLTGWPRAVPAGQGGSSAGGGGPPPVMLAAAIAGGAALTCAQLTITQPQAEEAETTALVARMAVPPSAARRSRIDQTIAALKTAGVWAKLDHLYLLAAADEQAARLNWVAAGSIAKVNAPAFTADRGYAFDGATSYLTAGEPFGGSGRKWTQNGAFLAAWNQNGANGPEMTLIGADTLSGPVAYLNCSQTAPAGAPVNSGGGGGARQDASRTGFHGVSRTGATSVFTLDGAALATFGDASTGVPAGHVVVGKIGTYYNSDRRSALAWGAALSQAQMVALRDALQSYMTAVGA